MISHRRRVVATALIMVALAVGGCTQQSEPLPFVDVVTTRSPAPLVRAHCPSTGTGLRGGGSGPATGTIPKDFRPASVLRCRLTDESPKQTRNGRLRYTVAVETAPVTDRFLDTLDLPDQAFDPADHAACDSRYRPPVYLLLTDRKGRAIRPQLPVDPCRLPRDEVAAAIDDLGLTVQRSYTFTVAPG